MEVMSAFSSREAPKETNEKARAFLNTRKGDASQSKIWLRNDGEITVWL